MEEKEIKDKNNEIKKEEKKKIKLKLTTVVIIIIAIITIIIGFAIYKVYKYYNSICYKPIIYLYATKESEISIKL